MTNIQSATRYDSVEYEKAASKFDISCLIIPEQDYTADQKRMFVKV